MNEIELIDKLIEELKRLPYRNGHKLDILLKRTELIMRKTFGEESHYLTDLIGIHFFVPFAPASENDRSYFWNSGIGELSNLLNVMKEDIELTNLKESFKKEIKDTEVSSTKIDPLLKKIKIKNPWLTGIIDNLLVAKTLFFTKQIETKNRISLILTDDALELGFKNYILKVKKFRLPEKEMKFRENLHKMVKKHTEFPEEYWQKIEHFYSLRSDLYHEEGEKTITDSDFENYYDMVLNIIGSLFSLEDTEFKSRFNLNIENRFLIPKFSRSKFHRGGKSFKVSKKIENKIIEDIINQQIPLRMRELRFNELHDKIKAGSYVIKQSISTLIPFYHKLRDSSDSLEDIFFKILAIKDLYRTEEVKNLILEFWDNENLNRKFLEHCCISSDNRDIKLKLRYQLNIIFKLYSRDFISLKQIFQGLIEKCESLYFEDLYQHCDFERISSSIFDYLKKFLLDLSKTSGYNENQQNRILKLFQKFP